MDSLLLPWQHFLGRELRKDKVLQNSNDVTVTSFLNRFQHNSVILLENTKLYICGKLEHGKNWVIHVSMATHS